MSEIISTIPWHCGNSDGCTDGWHKGSYWAYVDGTFSFDEFSDGDHEDVPDHQTMPDHEEVLRAWAEYHQHVALTGEDPLGEFMVPRTIKKTEKWKLKFVRGLGGIYVARGKHHGNVHYHSDLPPHVVEYLGLTKSGRLGGFADLAELHEAGYWCGPWVVCHIDVEWQRSEATVRRELQAAARRALRVTP